MSSSTRRAFLKGGGLSLLTLGLGSAAGPAFLHRAAFAAPAPGAAGRRKTLVTIFQRGAMDGLMAVPPIDDRALRELRPRLAMPVSARPGSGTTGTAIDLDVGFGLHPAFDALLPLWREERLGIVHAVGSPDPTRSHFDAQDYMETGTPGNKGTRSGWLNRVVGELGHEGSPFRAVAMTSALPRSLYGEQSAIAVSRLDDFRLKGLPSGAALSARGFEALYEETSQDLLRDAGAETFEAIELLEKIGPSPDLAKSRALYPASPLGQSLWQIALLIKAEVGLEVAFAESGGWDTHVRQGAENGVFANRARDLAQSIAAFWSELGEAQDRVVVMTMTEFGRTVRENGSAGTDHGHGSCLFVLGNRVDGRKVHGEFPGVDGDSLYQGRDLAVTTDFRSVFTEVASSHLGIEGDAELFPGWSGPRLELFKT